MKKRLIALAGIAIMTWGNTSQAQDAPFYFGVKGGKMVTGLTGLGNATNGGFVIGHRFGDTTAMQVAAEVEYTTTVTSAESKFLGFNNEWDVTTLAGYAAFRSNGDLYVKGKVGYLFEDVTMKVAGLRISETGVGTSLGAGLGWRITDNSNLEVEYTLVEADIDFFSVGLNFGY